MNPEQQLEIINEVTKKVKKDVTQHIKPSDKTVSMFAEVRDCLDTHIKEQKIHEKKVLDSLEEMKPTYRMIRNVEITGEVIGKASKWILAVIFFVGTCMGALYSIKHWLNRP